MFEAYSIMEDLPNFVDFIRYRKRSDGIGRTIHRLFVEGWRDAQKKRYNNGLFFGGLLYVWREVIICTRVSWNVLSTSLLVSFEGRLGKCAMALRDTNFNSTSLLPNGGNVTSQYE